MHDSDLELNVAWKQAMSDIPQYDWDALAVERKSPFLDWKWLRLLETSGSASPYTGWYPRHLTLWSDGRLMAAAPLYLKVHSEGEFVFDHVWADVARRIGTRYYPKITGMSPFTPTGDYRFLIHPELDEKVVTARMCKAIRDLAQQSGLSGCSFHFIDPEWKELMARQGYAAWVHQSFVWENPGYVDFNDFLTAFNANQRKNIKRERRSIDEQGIRVELVQGNQVDKSVFDTMYQLYSLHNAKFGVWNCKYLFPQFFEGLFEQLSHTVLFAVARPKDTPGDILAMSMLVHKGDQLYGRYWGSFVDNPFLHFELCYYAPVQWAIRHKIARFYPGMGGIHKVRRGFVSIPDYTLHHYFDPRLQMVMETNIDEINRLEKMEMDSLNRNLPFSRSG